MQKRVVNVGLVGCGPGSFFAGPHQKAIHMDGTRGVIAIAASSNSETAMETAENWPYPVQGFRSYEDMIAASDECQIRDRSELDYVTIVTPNHCHFAQAMLAIETGIPVFCEKPMCMDTREARALVKIVRKKKIPFGLAHTYVGHWMSRLARYIVQTGLIGDVRHVHSFYDQGWLADRLELAADGTGGKKQAEWRTDPKRAGPSGCGGDIVTHALQELSYITGHRVTAVSARLQSFLGRKTDDHFVADCRLHKGATALVRGSQISIGHKNDMGIEVVGDMGALRLDQEKSECLTICLPDQPDRVYWRGAVTPGDGFLPENVPAWLMKENTLPAGHNEGFHDALARLHRSFEADVRAYNEGMAFECNGERYTNVMDGYHGIAFIEACVRSSKKHGAWMFLPKAP